MEKSYRDLFDSVQAHAAAWPELKSLVAAIEEVDDSDPLRIPPLKAMKRIPAPPINLGYAIERDMLTLYARNTVRKRKAPQPALCAQVLAASWLFDATQAFPAAELEMREHYLQLVHRSFGYLETRIANYFEVGHDSQLIVNSGPTRVLVITSQNLASLAYCA